MKYFCNLKLQFDLKLTNKIRTTFFTSSLYVERVTFEATNNLTLSRCFALVLNFSVLCWNYAWMNFQANFRESFVKSDTKFREKFQQTFVFQFFDASVLVTVVKCNVKSGTRVKSLISQKWRWDGFQFFNSHYPQMIVNSNMT